MRILLLLFLSGCLFSKKASLDYHISSDYAFFWTSGIVENYRTYFEFSDSLVVKNGHPYIIESIKEIKPKVYSIWTPTAYWELDLNESQISTYQRTPRISRYKTYSKLNIYEKRESENGQAYRLH